MLCDLPFFVSQYQKTQSKRATEIIDQDLAFISLFFYFKSSDSSQLGNVSCQHAQASFSTVRLFWP